MTPMVKARAESLSRMEYSLDQAGMDRRRAWGRMMARTAVASFMVAQLSQDYAKAKDWYERALAVEEKLENAPAEAKTCHQLGLCAHYAGDLGSARKWYGRSVAIFEGLGDKDNADKTKKLLDFLTDYERQGGDVEHPDCPHHKH